jgi:hypothetical protein
MSLDSSQRFYINSSSSKYSYSRTSNSSVYRIYWYSYCVLCCSANAVNILKPSFPAFLIPVINIDRFVVRSSSPLISHSTSILNPEGKTDKSKMSAIDDTPISPTLNSTTNQQRRDSLEKHLQTRPELQDLKDRHILLNTSVAPYVFFLASVSFSC